MGKLALLLILAAASIAVYHGASSGLSLTDSADRAADSQRSVLARAAAKTGWARAKQDLTGGFADFTIQGTNGTATYTVTSTVVGGDEVTVVSVGSVPIPGTADETSYTLSYRLRSAGSGDELPEFATYAVIADGDLSTSGNGSIVSPNGTSTEAEASVRVHANGTLHSGSGSTIIEGFGTYTTGVSGKVNSTFRPRSNPDGEAVLAQTDSVFVPSVIPSEILAAYETPIQHITASADYFDVKWQDVVLPGGTRDNPAVYYVEGGAALINVTFTGYAVVVAEGEVKLQATVRGTPEPGRTESALAVFTTGEISMAGGSVAHAALHANGGLSYKGGVEIYGNLIVAGDFSNGGGATVHHVPPAGGLFGAWAGGDPALELVAYREQ